MIETEVEDLEDFLHDSHTLDISSNHMENDMTYILIQQITPL